MTEHIDWLKSRQTGIGGSDVAAILGLSKWKTPLDVYRSKTEPVTEDVDNASMEWGRRLEPVIRQKYSDDTGMAVTVPAQAFRSSKHPFMIANVDGIAEDGRILEIKTARSGADWGEEGTDEIPEYYMTQVQHYMAVTGATLCDVAVLIGASDFRIYHVERDEELIQMLIKEEAAFWQLVKNRTPPAPRSLAEVQAAFTTSRAEKKEASEPVEISLIELAQLQVELKEMKEREALLKSVVQGYMAEADTLTIDGETVATWKSSKPVARIDTAQLKKQMPDVYNRFLKVGEPTRRFVLKFKTEEQE